MKGSMLSKITLLFLAAASQAPSNSFAMLDTFAEHISELETPTQAAPELSTGDKIVEYLKVLNAKMNPASASKKIRRS